MRSDMTAIDALVAAAKTCIDAAESCKKERLAIQRTLDSVADNLRPSVGGFKSVLDSRFQIERLAGQEHAYMTVAKGIRGALEQLVEDKNEDDEVLAYLETE